MELLHDSSGLVESLDCQLKRLEEKIDTSRSVALMKDLHRLDDEIRHFKDVISKINDISSRIDNLEKKIDLAVRELKSEARKTSFLRKLLWLD